MTDMELIEELIEAFGSEQRLADAIPPAGRRVILRWANGSVAVPAGAWRNISEALTAKIEGLRGLRAAVWERAGTSDE